MTEIKITKNGSFSNGYTWVLFINGELIDVAGDSKLAASCKLFDKALSEIFKTEMEINGNLETKSSLGSIALSAPEYPINTVEDFFSVLDRYVSDIQAFQNENCFSHTKAKTYQS